MIGLTITGNIMLSFFLIASALAGKLQDDNGFRGKQFGPATVLDEAPLERCVKNPEEGTLWICKTTISDHTVFVTYKVLGGYFWGVDIASSGYHECQELFYVLLVAWGIPEQEKLSVEMYKWTDTGVSATYTFYNIDNSCNISIKNLGVYIEGQFRETDRILERASSHTDEL